jgi:excisionase family DNA binding protein
MGAAERIDTPWLTYKDAAQYLSLAESTLKGMVSSREIPVYGSRRMRRFRTDMLDLWLTDRDLAMRKWREEVERGRPKTRK